MMVFIELMVVVMAVFSVLMTVVVVTAMMSNRGGFDCHDNDADGS